VGCWPEKAQQRVELWIGESDGCQQRVKAVDGGDFTMSINAKALDVSQFKPVITNAPQYSSQEALLKMVPASMQAAVISSMKENPSSGTIGKEMDKAAKEVGKSLRGLIKNY